MASKKQQRTLSNDTFWTINKYLANKIGLEETLVLQHLIEFTKHHKRNEIFQTYEQIMSVLPITEYKLKQCIKTLKELGIISVERGGIGYKNYYTLHSEVIDDILNQSDEPLTSEVNSTHQSEVVGIRLSSDVDINDELVDYLGSSDVDITSLKGELVWAINDKQDKKKQVEINNLENKQVKTIASFLSEDSNDDEVEESPVIHSQHRSSEFDSIFNDFQ